MLVVCCLIALRASNDFHMFCETAEQEQQLASFLFSKSTSNIKERTIFQRKNSLFQIEHIFSKGVVDLKCNNLASDAGDPWGLLFENDRDLLEIPRQCGNACAIGGVLSGAKFKCRAVPNSCQKPRQPTTHDPDPHCTFQPSPNSQTTPSLKLSSPQAPSLLSANAGAMSNYYKAAHAGS